MNPFDQFDTNPFDQFDPEPDLLDKVSSGTKRAFANVGNMADLSLSTLAGSAAALFGDKDGAVQIADEMEERRKTRNTWGAETAPGVLGKVAGGLLTLPMQVAAMGLSPSETMYQSKAAGETTTTGAKAAAIDLAGNAIGMAIPGWQAGAPLVRAATGGIINAGQEYLTKLATQSVMETEAGKKIFAPTIEDTLVAGMTGGVIGVGLGKNKIPAKGEPSELSRRVLDKEIRQAKAKEGVGSEALFVDKEGVVSTTTTAKVVSDAATIDLAKKQQAESLANEVKQRDYPEGQQLDLFEAEQRPLDLTFGEPTTKVVAEPTTKAPTQPVERWYTGSPEPLQVTRSLEEQAARPNAEAQKAGPGHYMSMDRDTAGLYGGKEGSVYTVEAPFSKPFDLNHVEPGTRVSNETMYNGLVESLGSKAAANAKLKEMGYDAITFTDNRGNKIANTFNPAKTVLEGPARKVETFLGDLELLPKEERPSVPDLPQTPRSPETLAIKQQEQKKLGVLSKTVGTNHLPKEWLDVTTLEEAKHLAKTEPDLKGGLVAKAGRRAAAGIQGQTLVSGNPLLRYIRYVAGNGRALQANLSQKLVTNKQDGLATKVQNLNGKELTSTIEALRQGSANKFKLTSEVMGKLGFNEKQRSFVEAYYKHSQGLLDAQNASRAELGFKPIEAHEGWFTDVWKGQYKTAVFDAKGDVVAFITTDTKFGQAKAKEHYTKQYPGATFGSMLTSGLNGKNTVDVFSGLNDVLAIVAKNDPKMAEVLARGQEVQKLANNDLFGVSKHELRKSGKVGGSEGNKPWLSREQNAKQAAKAMIDYFETAIEHTALQKPLAEINKLVLDTDINQPNAKEAIQRYGDHIAGKTGDVGKALNSVFGILDASGIGSKKVINFLGHTKNLMNRKFMGLNLGFLSAQILQPAQTWAPVASIFASKLGIPQAEVITAFAKGSQWALVENIAKWYENPKLGIAPAHIKEGIKYAEERGIHAFNELELSHKATKHAVTRKAGELADFTIAAGDRMTKLPAFLGLLNMLYENGVPLREALASAEKGLESGMTNYHPWERPQMYPRLGVLGQFAGGLTTFKHSQANLYMKTIQEAFGKSKDPRSMLLMTGSMVFFAGITGMMGYAEADQIYGKITEITTGKARSIREDLLQGLPEFLKSGVISAASRLNWQAKVSSADMVPDTLPKALSPHLDAATKVVGSVAKAMGDPSTVNIKAAGQELMPTGLSKLTERFLNTDEEGQVMGKDGLPKYEAHPDPEEEDALQQARKTGSWLGMGTLYDAVQGSDLHKDRQVLIAQQAKQKALAQKIKGALVGNEFARAVKLAAEYDEVSGVPGSGMGLVKQGLNKTTIEKTQSPRQRAQGTPSNLQGVRKWETFNDGE